MGAGFENRFRLCKWTDLDIHLLFRPNYLSKRPTIVSDWRSQRSFWFVPGTTEETTCSMFLPHREKWMTYVAEEVKAILLKPHVKHASGVHLPGAIEESKLQIESSLNRTKCGNWVEIEHFFSKQRKSRLKQHSYRRFFGVFLIRRMQRRIMSRRMFEYLD